MPTPGAVDHRRPCGITCMVVLRHGDVLINNAGVALFGDVEEVSLADIEWLMAVNFWGVVYGIKHFLPVLKQRPTAHIVNLSSVSGIIALPGQAAYAASKSAVRGLSEALRHELGRANVQVSTVHPGVIRTAIAQSGRVGAGANLSRHNQEAALLRAFPGPAQNAQQTASSEAYYAANPVSSSAMMPGKWT
jgi:short-subunit dehydrogenase